MDFKKGMALFGGWTVAMGRKALCWEVFVVQVCVHLSSANAGLEGTFWKSTFPENMGGSFQHFGLFHAYTHEKFAFFFAIFEKSHCFSSVFGESAIAVLQTLLVQQHSGISGFLSPGARRSCCSHLRPCSPGSLNKRVMACRTGSMWERWSPVMKVIMHCWDS